MTRAAYLALVRALLRQTVPWLALVVAGLLVLYAAIAVGIAVAGTLDHSVWASVHWVLQWVGFAAGVLIGAATPVLVAHGVTRHRTAVAAAGTVLLIAAGLAVGVLAGLVVERLAYQAAGLPHRIDGSHLFDRVDEVHLVLGQHFLIFAGFLTTGWLVGTWYTRVRPRWATAALPLTLLPAAVPLLAISAGWRGPVDPNSPFWVATISQPLSMGVAAAAIGAGLTAAYLSTRRTPIK